MSATIDEADVVEPATTNPIGGDPRLVLQAAQLALLLLCVMYIARSIVMPIVLAIVLKMVLQPAMRRLEKIGIPGAIAAVVTLAGCLSLLVGAVTALTAPAQSWAARLPDGLTRLQEKLHVFAAPIDAIRRFLHTAESYTQDPGRPGDAATVVIGSRGGLSETLFNSTATFASTLLTTVLIALFLLLARDNFLRRLVEVLPRFADKRRAVEISQQIESDIAGYLVTITLMNAAVGTVTALLMWAFGLDSPVLWGAAAFLLNFVPLLGPICCMVILTLAGLLTFDPLWRGFLPLAGYLVVHITEGQFVTPMLVARRLELSPVLVVISVIFWFWMWGVAGAIIAVPMLAILKIICDRIPPWKPIGHLLGA